jgi:hypothetical protein
LANIEAAPGGLRIKGGDDAAKAVSGPSEITGGEA